jgi:hypothetical protein
LDTLASSNLAEDTGYLQLFCLEYLMISIGIHTNHKEKISIDKLSTIKIEMIQLFMHVDVKDF